MSTKIEWCDETWNPVTGCTRVSEACENCYALKLFDRNLWGYGPELQFHKERLVDPAELKGDGKRIFTGSMTDMFHEDVKTMWLGDTLDVIEKYPQHIFMMLTKRPKAMEWFFSEVAGFCNVLIPDNLWLGVTAENQERVYERIPRLLATYSVVQFVSVEPMLGPVDLLPFMAVNDCDGAPAPRPNGDGLKWVICGAETGPKKRHMELDWARSLRDQCKDAGVPFFFKKDSDGNSTLDGVEHKEFPI